MIIYACIARCRDGAVLVEVTSPDLKGNLGQVVPSLIQNTKSSFEDQSRRTIVQRNEEDFFGHFYEACYAALGDDTGMDSHYFHLTRHADLLYVCVSDDEAVRDQNVNFAFLDHMNTEFTKLYRPRRIDTAKAYSLNANFSPNVRSAMHYHNVNRPDLAREEKVQAIMTQVEDFKKIMGRNINILLENSQTVNTLLDMSDNLRQDALVFQKKSKVLRAKKSKQLLLVSLFCAGVIAILIYMAVVGICGTRLEQCKGTSSSGAENANYANNNNANSNANDNNAADNNNGKANDDWRFL